MYDVTFVSVWDGGIAIASSAKYDPKRKVVFDVQIVDVDEYDLEVLERQYVLIDGARHEIAEADADGEWMVMN